MTGKRRVPRANRNGDCYETAARMVLLDDWRATIVHGTVTGQGPVAGIRFGHAWLELGDLVFDFSNGKNVAMPRERYYEIGDIREEQVRRYEPEEARAEVDRTGHWGPWAPVIGSEV